uniref:RNA polymerase II-associated protein 3-like n=1 Tax=Phallusia mammillata TaxID=59560 RepID=A0A6F9DS06_9ASCI|nr:RNA polymerase II-associated protein 3-like [Phallusia mammillata]
MSPDDCKRLVAAIVEFLENELKRDGVTPDMAESIDVARQCLYMAYATTPEDVPSTQKKLIDIFVEACPAPPPAKELNDEEKAVAEKFKQEGNGHMREERYEEAISCYDKAIAVDSCNAVYYCNRAAAHTGRQKFDLSLRDCKKALEIDPQYSKAYSRMGLTYSKMEIYDEAIKCYEKALELDPNNEGYKKNMEIAQEKQKTQAPAGMPGMPSGMPGMPPGMGGIGNFLNNPMFMNMAKQVMENPQMQQMAMNLMGGLGGPPPGSDAGSSSQSVESGSGEAAANAAQPPQFSDIMQMGQQFAQQISETNPELVEQLRQQVQNSNTSNNTDSSDQPQS